MSGASDASKPTQAFGAKGDQPNATQQTGGAHSSQHASAGMNSTAGASVKDGS